MEVWPPKSETSLSFPRLPSFRHVRVSEFETGLTSKFESVLSELSAGPTLPFWNEQHGGYSTGLARRRRIWFDPVISFRENDVIRTNERRLLRTTLEVKHYDDLEFLMRYCLCKKGVCILSKFPLRKSIDNRGSPHSRSCFSWAPFAVLSGSVLTGNEKAEGVGISKNCWEVDRERFQNLHASLYPREWEKWYAVLISLWRSQEWHIVLTVLSSTSKQLKGTTFGSSGSTREYSASMHRLYALIFVRLPVGTSVYKPSVRAASFYKLQWFPHPFWNCY